MNRVYLFFALTLLFPIALMSQAELITNGSFQTTNYAWAAQGNFYYNSAYPNHHSAPGYAYLSNSSGQRDNNLSGSISQDFNIPTNTLNLVFSFWYSITTDEMTTTAQNDKCEVAIVDPSTSATLATLTVLSNLDKNTTYSKLAFYVSGLPTNKNLRLVFSASTNNSNPTVFRIDDVSLIAIQSSQCITWTNNTKPVSYVDSAMEYLCATKVINNSQDVNQLSQFISKIELARLTASSMGLLDTDLVFLDNFPNQFVDLNSLPLADQRYMKFMLYLEHQSKLGAGTDNISPYSRDYYLISPNNGISKSSGIKAILEAFDVQPFMVDFDPTSTAISTSHFGDVKASEKNLGWLNTAKIKGWLNDIILSPCGTLTCFGQDNNLTKAQAYVIIYRLLKAHNSLKSIGYDDFFYPNIFYLNNLNQTVNFEKGVFHEFSDKNFSIPGGGLPLEFTHAYHSNLAELPLLNFDNESENTALKQKLQPLGGGWTHSYTMFCKVITDVSGIGKKILIMWPDGTTHSYDLSLNKYESKGITDKLTIDSTVINNLPGKITIHKGRTKFIFRNIDPVSYTVLSIETIIDNNSNSLNFSYSTGVASVSGFEPKLLTKVTDSYSGRSLIFTYAAGTNYLSKVTDPIGRELKFFPNKYYHDLDSFSDAKGNTTKYAYYNFVGTLAYPAHLLYSITKPNGNVITNSYYSRKLKQTRSANYVMDIVAIPDYREQWTSQSSSTVVTQGGQTIQTNYLFDALGNIINQATPVENTIVKYDAENRLIEANDQILKFKTRYEYDGNGYLNKKVTTDSIYNDSLKYEYVNNQYGEVTKVILSRSDPHYYSLSEETTIGRDANGNITKIAVWEGTGLEVKHDFYYLDGLLQSYVSPAKHQIQLAYNSFGNVKQIQKISKPFIGLITEDFTYDNASRLRKHSDYEGKTTHYNYDNNDNLTGLLKDSGQLYLQTQYGYDKNDNDTSITSPNGHKTILKYDFNSDDLIEENDGSFKKRWKYNEDGSLDSFITKNNVPFKYQYYNNSLFPNTKLTGLLFSDGYTHFTYNDNTKNVLWINNSGGKMNRYGHLYNRGKWNKPDFVFTEGFFDNGINDFLWYGHDPSGQVSWIAYPPFKNKNYEFEYMYERGLKKIETLFKRGDFNIKYTQYTYQRDGQPLTEIYGNGDTIHYHYDNYNRLDSIWAVNKSGTILYTIGASSDKNGKHIREDLKIYYKGAEVTSLPTLTNQTKSYSYQTRNTIITGGGRTFTNSNAGEVISASNPTIDYTWNQYSQLTKVKTGSDSTIYDYDCLGIRKRKDDIYYIADQEHTGNMVMEATKDGTPISAYIYGNGLVARIDGKTDSIFYYHFDFRGSVIAITNQDGEMVQYYKYEPFGKVYDKDGKLSWNNPFQYVGKYGVQADDSDLYYMKARYYQPSTGRFLSEDPVWNTNLFVYGDDDPVNNIDPNGDISRSQIHNGLDVIGLIPGIGEIADGANALLYLSEGDKKNAALSAFAVIPVAGTLATAAKQGNFAKRLFLNESFGITSKRFANSATGVQGTWNQAGAIFKMGWSGAKDGGGMQLRIGIGRNIGNSNKARFHLYVPKTFVPNNFANPSIQVKQSLFRLGQ